MSQDDDVWLHEMYLFSDDAASLSIERVRSSFESTSFAMCAK